MKIEIRLTHPGTELELSALAGQVVLQVLQRGRLPATVVLCADAAGHMIDALGLLAAVAEEQAAELRQLVDKVAPPRELASDDDDVTIPARLGPLPPWEPPRLIVYGLKPPKAGGSHA